MTCLEFFNIRSHSTGDIASTGNSNDDPLSSCIQEPTYKLCPQDEPEKECGSDDDSDDSFIVPYMKKSHSLNIIHESDKRKKALPLRKTYQRKVPLHLLPHIWDM